MASNQRLLFFPIAVQVGGALLILPVTIASHDTVTFDVYARDAADGDRVMFDLLRAASTSATTLVAIAVAILAAVPLMAWLGGSFIRSIGDGALRWWPGTRAFGLLCVLYLATTALGLGLAALNASGTYNALTLPALLAISIPFNFADYSVVIEEKPLPAAIVRSARIWMRRPGPAMLTLITSIVVAQVILSLFVDRLTESDGVFPGFFGALLLVQALFAYASDCVLIALLLETPEPAPTAPGSALPE
jgi:hypothetical protein